MAKKYGFIKNSLGDVSQLSEYDYVRKMKSRDEALLYLVDYKSNPDEYLKRAVIQALANFYTNLLNAEFLVHLGYEKSGNARVFSDNRRNGYMIKTVRSSFGPIEVHVPRDREGTFTPIAIRKHSRAVSNNDAKVMSIYAHALDDDQIADVLHKLYFRELSDECIAVITEKVLNDVKYSLARRLKPLYPLVLLARISFDPQKHVSSGEITENALFIIQGIDGKGNREILEIFFSPPCPNASAVTLLESIKSRGVDDVMMVIADGINLTVEDLKSVFRYAVLCNDVTLPSKLVKGATSATPQSDAEVDAQVELQAQAAIAAASQAASATIAVMEAAAEQAAYENAALEAAAEKAAAKAAANIIQNVANTYNSSLGKDAHIDVRLAANDDTNANDDIGKNFEYNPDATDRKPSYGNISYDSSITHPRYQDYESADIDSTAIVKPGPKRPQS